MKIINLFTLVFLFGASAVTTGCNAQDEKKEFEKSEQALKTATKYDYVIDTGKGPVTVKVRLALDDISRSRGLMYLRKMPESEGMLFIYPTEGIRSFWMKNTYIPLDLIYIKRDGKITQIRSNVPPHTEDPRPSTSEVLGVLELNAGVAEKLGIKVGDKAPIPRRWRLMAEW